jgi:CHAD domain-containing protein
MNNELLDVIKIANREFQEFIDQVSQTGSKMVESRGAARRLAKVDVRLKQISQYLTAVSGSTEPTPEEAYEFLKYRENLKALRNAMETLQFSLLSERARLENVRANMQAACAWAASVREIS